MNRAILTTLILVLVFLVVNSVYLVKLTVELQRANEAIASVEQAVHKIGDGLVALGDAVEGELRAPAEDVAETLKKKIEDLDVEGILRRAGVRIERKGKEEQTPPSVVSQPVGGLS